ncbi:Enoyl-CoA hydratase [invertebrate metagenome]|uniref:Enoyl-CoA hydratase n=1 Tax=invertebrate metagenome TaxID=1711999 RepID=A0A484H769_9ZZZZ
MTGKILVERNGLIATVLINKPEQLNALDRSMWQELGDVCVALDTDSTVRCLILRGASHKAFTVGADVKMFATERGHPTQARAYDHIMRLALAAVRDHAHPVVAAIEGLCLGGGLALAAMADLRLCGQGSRFGIPVHKLGLPMPAPEINAVMRLVGHARMLEILLEARIFDAAEALAIGLVNRVVADNAVEAEAIATAQRIVAGAPLVNLWHKRFIRKMQVSYNLTAEELNECYQFFNTEDYQEGLRAFHNKRTPVFTGR